MKKLCTGALILMALGTSTIVAATDIGPYYWVLKKEDFNQTSSSPPSLTAAPFQLGSLVERASRGTLSSGTITPPGSGVINTPQPYTQIADGLEYNAYTNTQANLEAAFGSGGYHLDLNGGQGNYSVTLSLVGNTYPAETPKLNNSTFNNGELVVDAAAPLTLSWNLFADQGPLDVILLSITDGSGVALLRNVLAPTAMSQALAANFLKPEQTYNVELSFIKVSDKNVASISGSTGLAGYALSTKLVLSTSSRTPVSGFGNISTRSLVGTGDNVLIAGFIVTSTDATSKLQVVVRAIGPSLTNAGISDALQDPTLDLFDEQDHLIASNDEWANTAGASQIIAAGLAPTNSHESALFMDLVPGSYTAIVRGKNSSTGVGLAEVYNLGGDGDAKPANISTRGQVKTGDQVMIGGLIIKGAVSHNVIVRAIGPSLTNAGVVGALQNPTIELFNVQGVSLAFDDNWKDTQQSEIQGTGIPPTNDQESAIVQTLSPGNYTAIVKGKGGTTGVGLVEAYLLD